MMTKPMVTTVASKSDFMFKNSSNYKESHILCLASTSTWKYFDNYMLPLSDEPIKVPLQIRLGDNAPHCLALLRIQTGVLLVFDVCLRAVRARVRNKHATPQLGARSVCCESVARRRGGEAARRRGGEAARRRGWRCEVVTVWPARDLIDNQRDRHQRLHVESLHG